MFRAFRQEDRQRARAALREVEAEGLADREIGKLSGGELQRVLIARGLAAEARLLLLDEPTASLDPAATRAVEEIIAMVQKSGCKIVMTTHDLGQARRLADEVFFLHGGRLLEHAPAEKFFAGPHSEEGRAFLRGELSW